VRAVLFDLDGTLLDLDLALFLRNYFASLGEVVERHFPGGNVMHAILAATEAVQRPHPGQTNRDVFYADFLTRTGIDLSASWEVFDAFYRERFPALGDGCRPRKGARRAVETALALGLDVVVATQPIFPRIAIEHRLEWAGLSDLGLKRLTTYEIMHACKPLPDYFREAAAMAGHEPAQCLMVGDDRALDMPASDVGMRTFYVGSDTSTQADWCGDLDGLADLLPRLAVAPRQTDHTRESG
jgi:FMN phosphatase YigB (HAD superfamily)